MGVILLIVAIVSIFVSYTWIFPYITSLSTSKVMLGGIVYGAVQAALFMACLAAVYFKPKKKNVIFMHDFPLYHRLGADGGHVMASRIAEALLELAPGEVLEVDLNFSNRHTLKFLKQAFGNFPSLGVEKSVVWKQLCVKHKLTSFELTVQNIIRESYE